ncbi:MAG: outer membrane protein transport protein [Legionellales bacterium]|nr:outer membrane protein transport protein [Legionellales bacterium]
MLKNVTHLLVIILIVNSRMSYCAVDQILTSNFFQNPAELSTVNSSQVIGGNVFITPILNFSGVTPLGSGQVQSKVSDNLPYLLIDKRLSDKFVIGINATPGEYGHLNWPIGSIVDTASTKTEILYYRFIVQSSYQISSDLSLGIGLGDEYEKTAEIDFVIPEMGNQINKVSGNNFIADVGLYYKIDNQNHLTIAAYSPINNFGFGTSTLGTVSVNNFSLNIVAAPVAYIGLQHIFNEKWYAEGKIYWSGWSIEKSVIFINTTTGSFSTPTNWYDVWSFQGVSRYAVTENFALLGGLIYETNPVPTFNNQIGYPLAASGAISAGLDIKLHKNLSSQIMYGYGAFIPNAVISNTTGNGTISASFQSLVVQLTYKT